MTNYKQLCAELSDALIAHGQPDDAAVGYVEGLIARTRAALAESEPEGPTDEEIMALMPQKMHEDLAAAARALAEQAGTDSTRVKGAMRIVLNCHVVDLARAVLARWGNHQGILDSSTLQPVPVSERLPGPEDCNDEGEVWAWRRFDLESGIDNGDFWRLTFREWLEHEDCSFTHWLPAHALPLPTHD